MSTKNYTIINKILFSNAKRIMSKESDSFHMGWMVVSEFINWIEQNYELKEKDGPGTWEKLQEDYKNVQEVLKKLTQKESELNQLIKMIEKKLMNADYKVKTNT